MKRFIWIIFFLIVPTASALDAQEAANVPPANPEQAAFANKILGFNEVLELTPTIEEKARFGSDLEQILDEYEDGHFISMQDKLVGLYLRDPKARESELIRLLEAESYFFNGRNAKELRVRFAKPIYRDLLSAFPRSGRSEQELFRYSQILFDQEYAPEALGYFQYLEETQQDGFFALKVKLMIGQILLAVDRASDAASQFQKVLASPKATEGETAMATIGEALCRLQQGDPAEAEILFDRVVRSEKDRAMLNETALLGYGRMYQQRSNYPTALEVFTEFIRRYPESSYRSYLQFQMSEMLAAQGNLDAALDGYLLASANDSHDEWAVRAALRFAELKYSRAPGVIDEEVEENIKKAGENLYFFPIREDAQFLYSRILHETGRELNSIELSHDLLSRAQKAEKKKQALDIIAVAYEDYLREQSVKKNYGEVCRVTAAESSFVFNERMKEETFGRVVEAFSENLVYDSLFRLSTAPKVEKLFPERSRLALAVAESGRGHEEKARALFESLMKEPNVEIGRQAAVNYLRYLSRLGNDQRVVESSEEALKLPHEAVDRAEILILRSRSRFNLGDPVTSAEGFRQALDLLMPAESERERRLLADALFGLGLTLSSAGHADQATPVLEAAIGAFPDDIRVGPAKIHLMKTKKDATISAAKEPYWEDLAEKMKRIDEWKNLNAARVGEKKG